ncbi:MAG TPA: protein kinase [Gaiellaceae bacterium]|jgi:serine/threonine-protein kinase|nr:protein kinase [Gaiellaceae bacterium]
MSTGTDPRVGSELLEYHLGELIGRGGMGVVYRAHDPRLKREVALKVLAPEYASDERFRERFLIETEAAAALEHPNVIPIHDAGEVDGQLYLVMRLATGGDLKQRLAAEGMLEPREALALCGQVADALDAAHARGLVHRDVKPSNILLDHHSHVYLADFGLSRRLSEQAPGFEAGLSLGTPAYVAPEQIEGKEIDGRADQYSLACLLHECLTGRPPFPRGSEAAVLFAHLEEPPPAPPGLEAVMRRALAKDPDGRYGSCRAFVADAREALGVAEPVRRGRWPLLAAAALLGLTAVAALLALLVRGDAPPTSAPAGRLIEVDAARNTVTDTFSVGAGPEGVAVGSGRVWVASYHDGTLWRLDPSSGAVTKIAAFGRPYAVAIDQGSAYVAALGPSKFVGNLSKFDAVTGGRVGGIDGLFVCSLASGTYGVWVAGCPNVQQIESQGARQDPRIRTTVVIPFAHPLTATNYREALAGTAVGEGGVWAIGDASDRRLWRIDPAVQRIAATISLGFPPGGVAAGGGAVWVTDQLGDAVVRVDPQTNRVGARIPVGRGAGAVAYGNGSVWVVGAIDHTLTRIDARTNDVVETIRLSATPKALAAGEGAVWVVGDAR